MEANWKQTLTAIVRDNRNDGKPWKMVQKFKKKKKSFVMGKKKFSRGMQKDVLRVKKYNRKMFSC